MKHLALQMKNQNGGSQQTMEEDCSVQQTSEEEGLAQQTSEEEDLVHRIPEEEYNQLQSNTEESISEDNSISEPESEEDFVRIKDYIPNLFVELKYNTEDNFTGQKIYDFSDAYLRYGTVKKLIKVNEKLKERGLTLKIWDAFRPVSAQFVLWEVYPDATYVANPNNGYSSHSKGNTVDLTLVTEKGEELIMPTGFDDFSSKADRDYSDCSKEAAANARILEKLMEEYGFKGYFGEWWHFTDRESYSVEKDFNCKGEE